MPALRRSSDRNHHPSCLFPLPTHKAAPLYWELLPRHNEGYFGIIFFFFSDGTWIFFNRDVLSMDTDTLYLLEESPIGVSLKKKHQMQPTERL